MLRVFERISAFIYKHGFRRRTEYAQEMSHPRIYSFLLPVIDLILSLTTFDALLIGMVECIGCDTLDINWLMHWRSLICLYITYKAALLWSAVFRIAVIRKRSSFSISFDLVLDDRSIQAFFSNMIAEK